MTEMDGRRRRRSSVNEMEDGGRRQRRSSVKETHGHRRSSLKELVVDEDTAMEPGACTVWVGGIPNTCVKGPAALTSVFSDFGKVMSVTVRRKEGELKNWAFITFVDAVGMAAALENEVRVPGDTGKEVRLTVKEAKVDKELQKSSTGALAGMWADQERKIEAVVRIQAAMRGRKTRNQRATMLLERANSRRITE